MFRHIAAISGRLLAIVLALGCWTAAGRAQSPASADGLDNSAEYIMGFVRYLRWPGEERLPAWRVCVIGDLPRAEGRAFIDRTVRGKPFVLSYLASDAPIADCQVLDLTAIDPKIAPLILSRTRKTPILTVGTGSGFCSAGGKICLHLESGAPTSGQKFEVNLSTISESSLEVSARLLTVGSVHAANERQP